MDGRDRNVYRQDGRGEMGRASLQLARTRRSSPAASLQLARSWPAAWLELAQKYPVFLTL